MSNSNSATGLRKEARNINPDEINSLTAMTQLLSHPSPYPPVGGTSTWKIGWKTPVYICTFYLTALLLAIGHFIFAWSLNGQAVPIDGFLRQSYVSAISIAFALSFRSMLSASLSISFIQRLWSLFRLKAMKVSTIDSLLSLLQSPLKLLHFEVLWNARFEWGFAIFCFCIPIATVFPPGALSVVLKEQRQLETNKQVPTFIPTSKLTDNLAFHNGSGIQLVTPRQEVVRVAYRSIMAGSYISALSPCGQNCTYGLTFQGPTLQCSNVTYQNLSLSAIYADYSVQGGDYRAAGALVQENFDFELHYYKEVDLQHEFDPEKYISCFLRRADYFVNVTYTSGTPILNFQVNNSQPINSTTLLVPGTPRNYTNPQPALPDDRDSAAIENLNIWAIYQSMVQAMSGDVGRYGEYDQEVNDTIVLESSLVQYLDDGVRFDITEDSLNSMLHNITLSTFSLRLWDTSTDVVTRNYVNTYSFAGEQRYSMVVPYAVCLLLALAFVSIGLASLYENSVGASNGFLQTIQTTRGSIALDIAARGSSLGGPDNIPVVLEDLELMFGELKEPYGKEGAVRRAGWGTRDEVRPLVKGEYYDG